MRFPCLGERVGRTVIDRGGAKGRGIRLEPGLRAQFRAAENHVGGTIRDQQGQGDGVFSDTAAADQPIAAIGITDVGGAKGRRHEAAFVFGFEAHKFLVWGEAEGHGDRGLFSRGSSAMGLPTALAATGDVNVALGIARSTEAGDRAADRYEAGAFSVWRDRWGSELRPGDIAVDRKQGMTVGARWTDQLIGPAVGQSSGEPTAKRLILAWRVLGKRFRIGGEGAFVFVAATV